MNKNNKFIIPFYLLNYKIYIKKIRLFINNLYEESLKIVWIFYKFIIIYINCKYNKLFIFLKLFNNNSKII